MKKILFLSLVLVQQTLAQTHLKMQPVNFSKVTITDNFWKPKLDKVATKTLDACIYQTEVKTPRDKQKGGLIDLGNSSVIDF